MSITIAETDDLDACLTLRHAVFVQEQGVPQDMERDALDGTAIHLIALENKVPLGTARIVCADGTGKIGRVCVAQQARGTGLGAALIKTALDVLRARPDISRAALGAQTDALGFYEKLGFHAYGPTFDDAGIPHQMMERAL